MEDRRIAIGGIHIESSTFTPYVSDEADFEIRRGRDLLDRYPWIGGASGYERLVAKWIPLVHARALPGGIVSRAFFDSWWKEFFGLLEVAAEKGPIDGVVLDIHGAMSVEGLDDAEGMIAAELRRRLPGTLITAPMDLHGNVSDLLFDSVDLLTCYRTAPHVDTWQTRHRAARHLLCALGASAPLISAKVDVPLLLPGEKTSTRVEPAASLYGAIDSRLSDSVADVSIWMGFPWADEPRCHAAVVAHGSDAAKVRQAAEETAADLWLRARDFDFVGPTDSTEGAIEAALLADAHPFFISDTGDNPGAGGAGDSVVLLEGLLRAGVPALFAALFDPPALARARDLGEGKEGEFRLGGYLSGSSVTLRARVRRLFTNEGAEQAVLEAGNMRIIVSSRRVQYSRASQYEAAGEPLADQRVVAVKIGYLEPDLAEVAAGWVMALSPGAVDQDLLRLGHRRLRPAYPFAEDLHPKLQARMREAGQEPTRR